MSNVIAPDRFRKRSDITEDTGAASEGMLAVLASEGVEIDPSDPLAGFSLNPMRGGELHVGDILPAERRLLAIGLGFGQLLQRTGLRSDATRMRELADKLESIADTGADFDGIHGYTDAEISSLTRYTDLNAAYMGFAFAAMRERLDQWHFFLRVAGDGKILQVGRRTIDGAAE